MGKENESQREPDTIGSLADVRKNAGFQGIGSLVRTNWPKYVVEIFVIIIGITLSFIIDNHKEEVNRAALEKAYLKNLLRDIDEDIAKLNDIIKASQQVVASSKNLLKLVDHKLVNEKQFAADFGGMLNRPNFISSNATFLDLRSGNSAIIGSTEIRNSLFNYHSFLELIKITENGERDGTINLLQPFLYHNFYMKGFDSEKKEERRFLPKGNSWKILDDEMFINIAASRLLGREDLIIQYEKGFVLAEKLKTDLAGSI